MKKVTVLLSTYNGEKYLDQLLDSVLSQIAVEVRILIRDDGSKDGTKAIIESYANRYSNISVIVGDNLGPAMSFIDLIKRASDSDYYAFCDQDDIWLENKLENAVRLIGNKKTPTLYYSNLKVVDRDLNYVRNMLEKNVKKTSRYEAFIENKATGCTMVFNNALMEILKKGTPEKCVMHDMWVNAVASIFGTIVYDDNAYILYRQHESNVIGAVDTNKSKASHLKQKLLRFNDKREPRLTNATEFWNIYHEELCEKDRRKIHKIIVYKDSIRNRSSLLMDKDIHSTNFCSDLKYRMLILAGRI